MGSLDGLLPAVAVEVHDAGERGSSERSSGERGAGERGAEPECAGDVVKVCDGPSESGPVPLREQSASVENLRHVFTSRVVSFSKRQASNESITVEGHVRMTRQVFQEVTVIQEVTVVDEHTRWWRDGHRMAEQSMLELCAGGKFMDLIVQSA